MGWNEKDSIFQCYVRDKYWDSQLDRKKRTNWKALGAHHLFTKRKWGTLTVCQCNKPNIFWFESVNTAHFVSTGWGHYFLLTYHDNGEFAQLTNRKIIKMVRKKFFYRRCISVMPPEFSSLHFSAPEPRGLWTNSTPSYELLMKRYSILIKLFPIFVSLRIRDNRLILSEQLGTVVVWNKPIRKLLTAIKHGRISSLIHITIID